MPGPFLQVMKKIRYVLLIALLMGTALTGTPVSAHRIGMISYTLHFEQNGTLSDPGIRPDFSLACYGHSYIAAEGSGGWLNTTVENPVPLQKVLDLRVHCDPADCNFSDYYNGDPERCEWCELNGTTRQGDPYSLNISPENMDVRCKGAEAWWDLRRCMAKVSMHYPCESYLGSRQMHCRDGFYEEQAVCMAAYETSLNQSNGTERQCGFGFVVPVPRKTPLAQYETTARNDIPGKGLPGIAGPDTYFWCRLLSLFGMRCD